MEKLAEEFFPVGKLWLEDLCRLRDTAPERMLQVASSGSLVKTEGKSEYRVRERIGQGSFSVVFLAERLSDNKEVAIKIASGIDAGLSAEYRMHKMFKNHGKIQTTYSDA